VAVLEQDHRVVVFLDADLAANNTGNRFQDTVVHEWRCDPDARITGFLCFCDTAKALQALGIKAPAKAVP
jgi:hypothetical protein